MTLRRTMMALPAMTLPLFYSVSVMALPAPKTPADLLAEADLVVDATSVAVECEGPPVGDAEKITTTYRSTLEPSHSHKGGLPSSFEIIGRVEDWTAEQPIGGWFQGPVAKGWAGKLYLARQADDTYTIVWWNAMVEDSTSSSPEALPDCKASQDAGVADALQSDGPLTDGPLADGPLADGPLADGAVSELDQGPDTNDSATDSSVASDGGVVADTGSGGSSDGGCRFGGDDSEGVPSFALALVLLGLYTFRRR